MEKEIRFATGAELRVEGGEKPMIKGYAAVFETPTDIGGMFTERVRAGAFRKTILEADVRALWNHDPNYVLGRNRSGTLRMNEDQFGLAIEIDPVDAQWSRDLQESMRRGDINQMSFAFKAIKDEWDNDVNERSLVEVKLFDVSVVTYPAYPQTSAQIRSSILSDYDAITGALFKASRGVALNDTDRMILENHCQHIRSFLSDNPEPDKVHSEQSNEPASDHSLIALFHRADVQRMILNTLL